MFTHVSHKKFENEALPKALTHKNIFQSLNIHSWSVKRGFFQSFYGYGPSDWYWKKIWGSFLCHIAAKWLIFAFEMFSVVMTSTLMDLSGQLAMKAAWKTWPCLQVIVKVCVPCGFHSCINATTKGLSWKSCLTKNWKSQIMRGPHGLQLVKNCSSVGPFHEVSPSGRGCSSWMTESVGSGQTQHINPELGECKI